MSIRSVTSSAVKALLLFLAIGLSACGGGGGDSAPSPGSPNPVPAPTPTPLPTDPPVITRQPQSQSVASGSSATFAAPSVNATSFRWQASTDDGITWTEIPSATGASLTLEKVALTDTATQYRALLTNVNGTTNSAAAVLTVKATLRLLAGGLGGAGFRDGGPAESRFNGPRGIASDASGNVYLADSNNHVVRRITPDGTATTVAGTPGRSGKVDGPAATARFDVPRSIAIDASGALWVVDQRSCLLRRVANGQVTTVADLGSAACYYGKGGADRNNPAEVAISPGGEIFVSDDVRHVIRRVERSGAVTVFAGTEGVSGSTDGPRMSAQFRTPRGLAFDASGNLYVADSANATVRRIGIDGAVTTLAGAAGVAGHVDGAPFAARFVSPRGVTVYGSYLYVSEIYVNVIRRIHLSTGVVFTLAGTVDDEGGLIDGFGAGARFKDPHAISADGVGNLYVADTGNHAIRRVTSSGIVSRLGGQPDPQGGADGIGAAARFSTANFLTADAVGNVYAGERFAGDGYGGALRKIAPSGEVTTLAGKLGNGGDEDGVPPYARLGSPSFAVAGPDGYVYVGDSGSLRDCRIRRVSPTGEVLSIGGLLGECYQRDGTYPIYRFAPFAGMAIDKQGNIAVSGTWGCAIRRFSVSWEVTTLVGGRTACTVVDGAATVANVAEPHALAFEPTGAIVFADTGPTVRRLRPDGGIETIAGSAEPGDTDGVGTVARFQNITSMAVDADGRIYVVDAGNHSLRIIHKNGHVRTLIPLNVGPRVVLGEGGSLNDPYGIALLPGGQIAISSEFAVVVN